MRGGLLRHKVTIKNPVETTDAMGSASDHWVSTSAAAWTGPLGIALLEDRVPTTANNFYYTCTVSGVNGASEPTWPTTIGSTVADNAATWTCTGFDCFAAIWPLKSTEIIQQGQLDNVITHRVRIRYRSDINSKMRIYFGSRVLRIDGIVNFDERNTLLELQCTEID